MMDAITCQPRLPVQLAMVEVDVSRIAWFADLLGQPVEAGQLCLQTDFRM